jgi:hypothetical protein
LVKFDPAPVTQVGLKSTGQHTLYPHRSVTLRKNWQSSRPGEQEYSTLAFQYCDNSPAQAGTETMVVDEDFSTLDSEDNVANIYANGTAASPQLGP